MAEKEEFYWLTVPGCSHISDIKLRNQKVDIKDLIGHIWFKPSETEEAKQFLNELRDYMRYLYCYKYEHQDRAEWMTEKWVETGNKLLDR